MPHKTLANKLKMRAIIFLLILSFFDRKCLSIYLYKILPSVLLTTFILALWCSLPFQMFAFRGIDATKKHLFHKSALKITSFS